MKIMSVILSFCITFNVLASTTPISKLERSIDDYQYSLTVEWDQQDKKFYNEKTDAFIAKLADLIKREGLTKEQILAMSEKRVQDKQAFEAMKLKMSLLGPDLSSEELVSVLKESSKEFYSKGASWNGSVAVYVPLALIAIIVGYIIWFNSSHECVAYEERYTCSTTQHCIAYDYDNYGSNHCYMYRDETICGYRDVCVDYDKK